MNRSRIVIAALIVAIIIFGVMYGSGSAPPAPTSPPSPVASPAAHPPPSQQKRKTAIPRPKTPLSLKHRPPPPVPVPAAAPPPSASSPSDPSGEADEMADEMAAYQAGLKLASEDMSQCLGQWFALMPDLHGSVTIAFDLDKDGLQNVWIVDSGEVPAGPLSCMSAAIWSVDWSGITEQHAEIENTYSFGPEAVEEGQ